MSDAAHAGAVDIALPLEIPTAYRRAGSMLASRTSVLATPNGTSFGGAQEPPLDHECHPQGRTANPDRAASIRS